MIESICLAGMLFASLWVTDSFNPEQNRLCDTVIIPNVVRGTGDRVPIVAPLMAPDCSTCAAPDHAEILRALPRSARGVPYVYEEFRNDMEFKVEKLVDRVDPPRFFPLIGPAQLHHCHWKCTVYFTDVTDACYPWPFRVQRRCAEVVYIDKDHLHLCADPSADASPNASPGNCAGGRFRGKEASNSAVQCNNAPQVQLEVVIAHVSKSALSLITFPWAENQKGSAGAKVSFGVLPNHAKFLGSLQTLSSNGMAKILAEPRLTTLSGKPAAIVMGGEIPVTTSDCPGAPSVTYKTIGTEINILPIVKPNGKIHLEVRPQITALDPASSTKTAPVFKTKRAVVVAELEAGQTVAIPGLTMNEEDVVAVIVVTARIAAPPGYTEIPPVPSAARCSEECPIIVPANRGVRQAHGDVLPYAIRTMEGPKNMTLDDIVRLSKHAGTEDIIVRQIELTNSVFNLTTQNLIDLLEQGVKVRVIRAMQESADRIQPASHCVPSMRPR